MTTIAMGSHYTCLQLDHDKHGRPDPVMGMKNLRALFPTGTPDELNVVMFSTSGVHGTYTTIEEVEASIARYGDGATFDGDEPDDYVQPILTVLVMQPRLVCTRYGSVLVEAADIGWLKELRRLSWNALGRIGADEMVEIA